MAMNNVVHCGILGFGVGVGVCAWNIFQGIRNEVFVQYKFLGADRTLLECLKKAAKVNKLNKYMVQPQFTLVVHHLDAAVEQLLLYSKGKPLKRDVLEVGIEEINKLDLSKQENQRLLNCLLEMKERLHQNPIRNPMLQ